ncbi:threonine ammonia-lyase [Dongia deserti]|uniref:threonine ammonia-lyase n=1 Tax=Dongia deserti TaxID=2268030 RepID=UPI000E65DF9A|nr:threonine/serine dehydratase [Dongia deserti]
MNISIERIAAAIGAIDPIFKATPQFLCDGLSAELGRPVLLKVETLNPIRSFKGRGTSWFAQSFAEKGRAVICASAGNFGQGIAYCGTRAGLTVQVVAPANANPLKLEAMKRFGAEVILHGHDFDAAKLHAQELARKSGGYFLEDGREQAIAEGAGTIALELLQSAVRPSAIYVPVGNGSLISGVAAWIKAKAPDIKVIGICPEGAPSMMLSWREGRVVTTDSANTIADGLAVRLPVPEAVAFMRDHIDDVVLVSDARMKEAMRLLFRHAGVAIEPSGAAGLAAIMDAPRAEVPVATILCGGNVRMDLLREFA